MIDTKTKQGLALAGAVAFGVGFGAYFDSPAPVEDYTLALCLAAQADIGADETTARARCAKPNPTLQAEVREAANEAALTPISAVENAQDLRRRARMRARQEEAERQDEAVREAKARGVIAPLPGAETRKPQ